MNTSRWTFAAGVLALGVVVVGVAIGAAAYFGAGGVRAQSGGTSEPSLGFVPQEASLIGYVDLKSIASSPLAESWSEGAPSFPPLAHLDEVRESTGIDILSDVDTLTLAVGPGTGKQKRWGIAVTGAFDRARLLEKIAEHPGGVETSSHAGTDLHVLKSGEEPTAVAFLEESTLLFGEVSYLREMLDAGLGRKPSASAKLESWGYGGFDEEAFWLAGAPPDFVNGLVSRGKEKPTLRSFAVTGRLDADLVLRARGRAADLKSAQELADVVRGLVALGRLRQDSTREGSILSKMAESVSVELAEEAIDVNLLVPYASIRELLTSQRKAAAKP